MSRAGEVTRLSADTRDVTVPLLRAGTASTGLALYYVTALASDSRGFAYLWDPEARRITVVGEPSTVEIDTQPSGRGVLVDGAEVVTPRIFRWLPGDYHTVEAPSEAGQAGFIGWSHGPGRAVTWMPAGGASRVVAKYGSE